MKTFFICICLGVILKLGLAQSNYSIFEFRSYNETLVLSVRGNISGSVLMNETGGIISTSNRNGIQFRYLFQGQEYDSDFGLYFFPSRIYQEKVTRFLQPDPKSQYHSPYLFVNADPVNTVDRNGKAGVPLVLYTVDHTKNMGEDATLMDLKSQVPRAHYVPMNDFVNGKVPDLDEWNGNVFIDTHTSVDGKIIPLELADHKDQLTTANRGFTKTYEVEWDTPYISGIEPERLGEVLRNYSEHRNIPIKNITSSGCQGGEAMERVGLGYVRGRPLQGEHELRVTGLKKGRYALIEGKNEAKLGGRYTEFDDTRFHVTHGTKVKAAYEKSKLNKKKEKFTHFTEEDETGASVPVPYAEGGQVEGILNGRIPEKLAGEFNTVVFEY